jgi:hypothetical protein
MEDSQGRLISQCLDLALLRWDGIYQDVEARWLRWATLEGALLPTPQEVASVKHSNKPLRPNSRPLKLSVRPSKRATKQPD